MSETTSSGAQAPDNPPNDASRQNKGTQAPLTPKKSGIRRFFSSIPVRIILGLIVLYFVVLLLVLPFGGRWFLEKKLTETLEVPCAVAAIRCNPFTLETRAEGIVIPYPGDMGTFLSVNAIELRPAIWQTLSTLTPNLGSLRITGPAIRLGILKDGAFSLSAYPFAQTKPEKDANEEEKEESKDLFPFVVNDFELADGNVSFWDMRHNLTQNINDIHIRIPFASSLPKDRDTPMVPDMRATIDGSPVVLDARSTLFADPVATELNIDLGRVPVERFKAYLSPYTDLNLEKAALSAMLSIKAGQLDGRGGFDVSVKGKIKLFDVNLVDPNEQKSVLTLGSGELEIERFLLRPQDISVNVLSLDRLAVSARRLADGSINWTRYFKSPAASASATESATPAASSEKSGLPPFVLKKLSLSNMEIRWQDDAVPGGMTHDFKNLSIAVSDLDTRSAKSAQLRLAFKDELFGDINVEGQYAPKANTLSLNADIAGFTIAALGPYLKALPVAFEKGAISTRLATNLAFAADMPLESLSGSISVTDLAVTDSKLWRVQTKEIQAGDVRFTSSPMELTAESLIVDAPKGTFTLLPDTRKTAARAQLEQISREVADIQSKEKTRAPGAQPQTAGSVNVESDAAAKASGVSPLAGVDDAFSGFKTFRVNKVQLKKGSFAFKDQRVSPATTGEFSNLNMTLANVSTAPRSTAQLTLTGLFDRAPFSVRGTVNPLKAPLNAALRMELDNLNMVRLSPFALQALAYPIESGLFTADLDIAFKNDVLDSTNHFVLQDFNLGPKASIEGAPDLPLPLAVALLKGPSGTIDLTVGANGRLDDPQFSVAGIVIKIIGNILVKVLTSPFTLVAGIFTSDNNAALPDLQYTLFAPGFAALDKQAKTNIAAVAALLEKRPALRLSLVGMADAADRSGLVDRLILEKMQAIKYDELSSAARAATTPDAMNVSRETDPEEYENLLYEVYAESSFPIPRTLFGRAERQPVETMLAAFHANIKPTDEDLKKLALERAEAVQKAILANAPALAGRVSVSKEPLLESEENDDSSMAAVRLDLTATDSVE